MKWVWRNLAKTCDLGDPTQHMQRWMENLFFFHRGFWKGLLRRAEKHAILQHAMRFQCSQFHCKARGLLNEHGFWRAPDRFAQLPAA